MRSPAKAYRQTQRETVSEGAALATLFAALVETLQKTRIAMAEGRRETVHNNLIACQKVLIGLRAGLNPGAGELAERLGDLYAFSEWTLGQANIHMDPDRLAQVLVVLGNLRDGFQGAAFPWKEEILS